tara:strand:+ start:297 stop:494 length:198 start_codon:yes stop_codon:yes gene_type:complete
MKLEDLCNTFSELNVTLIEVDSHTVVCTSALFTSLAMASDDTQGSIMSAKTDGTTLTTPFMKMFV